MKSTNVIAFDVGAGSGRVSVGSFDGDRIVVHEIHRFFNKPVRVLDSLHWNILRIFQELKSALARLEKNETYLSAGIDGWGADYGLIDRGGRLLGNVYHYRDSRTDHIEERLLAKIPPRELFAMTASDLKRHYTLSQIYAQVLAGDPLLGNADKLLLIPDLLNYMFTGAITAEITIAGTTQMLSPSGDSWNRSLLSLLEIPEALFPVLRPPGTALGPLRHTYEIETGCTNLKFVSVSGHDTASALTSVCDLERTSAFVSTGTTIVVGSETRAPLTSDACFDYGFKNCPGTEGRNLLMRNNTGFWILQQCRRLWERQSVTSYPSLSQQARKTRRPPSIFDPEAADFQNPDNMLAKIKAFTIETNQIPPQTRGDYTRSIYASLALQVRWCLEKLGEILGTKLDRIHLVGGAVRDSLFCEVVAECTGLPVRAGPAEATTTGNVMVQLLAAGEISSLSEIREVVGRSLPTRDYLPKGSRDEPWESLYLSFKSYKERSRACHEDLKQTIVEIARIMDQKNLVNTYEGNLSIKQDDKILITPSGKSKASLTPEMIAVIDETGRQFEGTLRYSSEFLLHVAAYRLRHDIHAAIHSHAPYLTSFALNNQPIQSNAYPEMINLFGKIPVVPYGTPGTSEIAAEMGPHIAASKVVLLANHGVLAVGVDLYDAFNLTQAAESIAYILTLAHNRGHVKDLTPEQVARVSK